MDIARNYCLSAETTLNFNTDDGNGKEMERREKMEESAVPGDQFKDKILENKPLLQCDESGKREPHRIWELTGLTKFKV